MRSDFVANHDREKRNPIMKKLVFALGLGALCLVLTGCAGEENTPAVQDIPTEAVTAAPAEPAPAPESAPPAESTPAPAEETAAFVPVPGVYTYQGEDALWTLTLRDSGPYTLQKEGDVPHTGESWADNGDGTIRCGPTDLWTEAFADSNGCSRWLLCSDGRCEPVFPG